MNEGTVMKFEIRHAAAPLPVTVIHKGIPL